MCVSGHKMWSAIRRALLWPHLSTWKSDYELIFILCLIAHKYIHIREYSMVFISVHSFMHFATIAKCQIAEVASSSRINSAI